MSKKIDLSVIMPVYNTEKYLKRAIDSSLNNLPVNSELIIINDGSKDNSESIIKEYLDDKRVVYYKKKNTGLADTKNFGISKAKGKYITFLDSDDYISDGMYKDCLSKAIDNNADIVCTDVNLVYEEDGRIVYNKCSNEDEGIMKYLNVPLMAASWNKIVKKSLYNNLEFPNGLNNEDIAVTPVLFAKAKKIIKIDKAYYNYYQRSGSIQNSKFDMKRFVIFDTSKILFDRIKDYSFDIQEQIKGSVYTHQLFAIYFYIIYNMPFFERIKYIKYFVSKINQFNDYYDNMFVIAYFNKLYMGKCLKYFKNNNAFMLILLSILKKPYI